MHDITIKFLAIIIENYNHIFIRKFILFAWYAVEIDIDGFVDLNGWFKISCIRGIEYMKIS